MDTTTLLAIDVGNTYTSFGLFATDAEPGAKPYASCRFCTPELMSSDECRLQLRHAQELMGVQPHAGLQDYAVALSCVVPALSAAWQEAIAQSEGRPMVVGPGIKTCMALRYDDPAEIGADRLAQAVAARRSYGAPCVVVDCGTTLNIEVVDASGAFAGGVIAPGLVMGAQAIRRQAAQLPAVELVAPQHLIATSTRKAMQAGVVWGEVARIEGLVERVFDELGVTCPLVMTGEKSHELAALIGREIVVDATLSLRGLFELWVLNRKRKHA